MSNLDYAELRAIPLTAVMEMYGVDRHRYDPKKYMTNAGPISIEGKAWYNQLEETGSSGALDLVMHLEGLNPDKDGLHKAACILAGVSPQSAAKHQATQTKKQLPKKTFVLPQRLEQFDERVQAYLSQTRGIPSSVWRPLWEAGRIYASRYGNLVMLTGWGKQFPIGAELKGTDPERPFEGNQPGSKKIGAVFQVNPTKPGVDFSKSPIAILECGIDAMSFGALHPEYTCLSTASAGNYTTQIQIIGFAQSVGRKVVIGFDNDKAGHKAYKNLGRHIEEYNQEHGTALMLPLWIKPPIEDADWNDIAKQRARVDPAYNAPRP